MYLVRFRYFSDILSLYPLHVSETIPLFHGVCRRYPNNAVVCECRKFRKNTSSQIHAVFLWECRHPILGYRCLHKFPELQGYSESENQHVISRYRHSYIRFS